MADGTIPPRLRQFIVERVNSYEQLNVLRWVFLRRDDCFSVALLAQELALEQQVAEEAVQHLLDGKLLVRSPDSTDLVRYQPIDHELDRDVGALTELLTQDPLPLIRTMTELSLERLRGSTLRIFADCFSVRKPTKQE